MLKSLSAVGRALRKGARRKPVKLALQGGGSHGAFTWGVLDQFLEDGRLTFSGISGTSAGAVNAVMLADGLARGGPEEARKRLAAFWRAASLGGQLPSPQRAVVNRFLSFLPAEGSPVQLFVDTMSRFLSPYDVNPLNLNPLKDLIEGMVDFEAVRACTERELFIAATHVQSGRVHIFPRDAITADVVMASAALPFLFRAVEIDGESYWDGGYMSNPPLFPLLRPDEDADLLVVQIDPPPPRETPTSARAILRRISEITFNASLAAEWRALEFMARQKGHGTRVNVHRIALSGLGKNVGGGSRLNTGYDFFTLLHRAGRRAARRFLDAHYDDIGQRSTVDLSAEIAAERA